MDAANRSDPSTAETRLELALSAGRLGTWSYNLLTGEQVWDAQQYALFGVSPDLQPTRELFERLVLPDDRLAVELASPDLKPGARHAGQFRIRRPDGQIRWLISHSLTVGDASGRPVELVGVNWDITDQKFAEDVLQNNAEQLQLALDAGRMGAWRYDLRSGRQQWNARQFELFGLPPDTEPSRELFSSLVLPEDLPRIGFTDADLRPGHFHDTEFRIRRPDGEVRWLTARSFARHDDDGRPIERIGVNWDVTEQKQRELDQAAIERRLALATGAAQIGIWEWRIQTGTFYYSPLARGMYGFSADEEISYEQLQARTYPEDYALIEPMLARALDPKIRSQETFRYRISRADTGEERWLLAHGEATFADDGEAARAISYVGTLQDITDDVRLEQALEDERARLKLALAASDLAIWELHPRTNTIVTSPELNRLYGFPEDSHPTVADFGALYAPGEAARVQAEAAASLARGETSIRFESKHQWPDGTVKWIGVRAQVTLDPKDKAPTRVIGVAMDVTERRLAEERMLTTTRELQHRVKNSLTVVQAIAAQSFRSAKTKEEGLAAFTGRLQALATATELITRGNWATISIEDIVGEIIKPYREAGSDRIATIGPPIRIDSKNATSLGMALHELCTNALKYGALCNDTGRVAITWSREEGALSLRWEESGGPPVAARRGKGFGTRLLEGGLFDPGTGSVEMNFEPSGVVCAIRIALSGASPTQAGAQR